MIVIIKEKFTDELIEYKYNPRDNDAAVEAVANSIKNFGFKVPIVIDINNVVIAGHTRLKAAKLLQIETLPCIIADDLSQEQIKAFRIADNKTAELAEWNMELLELELDELRELDFNMEQFGFDDFYKIDEPEIIEDEVPEVDEESEPITKRGNIWKLGEHYLMCGDATNKDDVDALMKSDNLKTTIDLLLTDPPYNVAYEGGTENNLKIQNDDMSEDDFLEFLKKSFDNADRYLVNGGSFYIWHASRTAKQFEDAMKWEIRQQLIWNKSSITLGRQDYQWKHEPCFYGWKEGASHKWFSDRKQTTILEFDKPSANKEHPTMKPVELIAYQIKNSTEKGYTIYDPFGGSGTTLIAAEQLERKCRTLELDERYADVIVKRWENLTGLKAEKV